MFFKKPAVIYLCKKSLRVAVFKSSQPDFYEIEWDGAHLEPAFHEIRKDLGISQFKLLLGSDSSFTLALPTLTQLNRANILEKAKQFIPADLDDHSFDWQLVDNQIQVVAVSPFLLSSISYAATKNKIKIDQILPSSVILAKITQSTTDPHLIIWSGPETNLVIAAGGLAYYSQSTTQKLTPETIAKLIDYAQDKFKLHIKHLIHDLPQDSLPQLPEDLKVNTMPLDPLFYLYKNNDKGSNDAQILNITPIKNVNKPPQEEVVAPPVESAAAPQTDSTDSDSKSSSPVSKEDEKEPQKEELQSSASTKSSSEDKQENKDQDKQDDKKTAQPEDKTESTTPQDTADSQDEASPSKPVETTAPAPVSTNPDSVSPPDDFKKNGFNFKLFGLTSIVVIFIVLLLAGGFFVAQKAVQSTSKPTPTPSPTTSPTSSPTPSPSPTPADLSVYQIQVLNGSGITGAAGKVQDILTAEDLTVADVANADSYDYQTTTVQTKADTPTQLTDTIDRALNSEYNLEFSTDLTESSEFDVVITVGQPTSN